MSDEMNPTTDAPVEGAETPELDEEGNPIAKPEGEEVEGAETPEADAPVM